jgi:ABC-type branched-subunit amino acid transport system substrate-binding protein
MGLALIAATCLLLASCQNDADEPYQPRRLAASPTGADSRLIGLVGTLSGPQAWRGEDAFEGADVAVQELNQAVETGEAPYELVSFDDGGDIERSTDLVEEAASEERMAGIVYAGPTEGLANAEDSLAEAGIPAVLVHGDLYGAGALTPHVFQAAPSYRWEARRIAAYLIEDRGYRRVGALLEGNADGSTAGEAMEEGLDLAGAGAATLGLYSPGAEDFLGQLDRMESAGVEAIVVQGTPAGFAAVLGALADRNATYRDRDAARTVTAPRRVRRRKNRPWRPQVVGFALAIAPREQSLPAGTVASDTYARGSHYLPVPSLTEFRKAFTDWWDALPTGWEQRSYDAVMAIGWAQRTAPEGGDLATRLEAMKGVRYGGLDITLGPDDHTFVDATTVGLWVVPGPGDDVRERSKLPDSLPWVPLSRGFSIDGERTDVHEKDWKYLFRKAPPKRAPAPPLGRMKFGINTPRRDPLH